MHNLKFKKQWWGRNDKMLMCDEMQKMSEHAKLGNTIF